MGPREKRPYFGLNTHASNFLQAIPSRKIKIMKIQINTDNHIADRESLVEKDEATITDTLGHLAKHVTRVEVHLSDENGEKTGGRDKRCMMEARLEGRQPIAVTDESNNLEEAIAGAADKLKSAVESTLRDD